MIVFEKRFSRTAFDYINVFSAYFSVPSISLKIIYIKGRLFEYLQKKLGEEAPVNRMRNHFKSVEFF